MRSSQLKFAYTFLRTQNFHQKLLSKVLFLSSTNSKAYSKERTFLNRTLICPVLRLKLEARERKMKPVNKLCFMLGNLMLYPIMRNSKHICKECNGGLWNWKKFVEKCKRRWQRSWNQEYQAMVIQDPCAGFVHDATFAYYLYFWCNLYLYSKGNVFSFGGVLTLFLSFLQS